MWLFDLIKRRREQRQAIRNFNEAINTLNQFFAGKYIYLVPVLGKQEFCVRAANLLIKKLESEGIVLTQEGIEDVQSEIEHVIDNSTYILDRGFGGMTNDEEYIRFISDIVNNFERFLQDQSRLPRDERFLSKQEALNVTEYIYNYSRNFFHG